MTAQDIQEPELASLVPERGFNRRDFVHTSLGSGFAAAVLPVAAQTVVKTDVQGLDAGEQTILSGDFKMPAYVARPAKASGKLPVMLVISEIFGVHEHIADVARRFAKLGYLAIAPELFVRQGDAGAYGEIAKLMAEVVGKVPDAQVMGDLDACVAWAEHNGGDTARLGINGFCWGGRVVWLYTAQQPKVKAGVAWYGRLAGDTNALRPRHPLDIAAQLKAPVLGLYGGKDEGIPLEQVDRMKIALAQGSAAAKASTIDIFPQAQHAFHADYRPSYDKASAEEGWKRCVAWFAQHGVA